MIGSCVGQRIVSITDDSGECRIYLESGETIHIWACARTSADHDLYGWLGYAVERREAETRPHYGTEAENLPLETD